MRIYLSGPMTGLPDWNYPAFHAAAARLRHHGHDVFNPAELDGGDTTKEWGYYLRRDVILLLENDVEAVAVLPGWRDSRGASLEVHVATALGIPVLDSETLEPLTETVLEEASRLVDGDRQASYGHPYEDYEATGRIWGSILDRWLRQQPGFEDMPRFPDIAPRIGTLMMAGLKISRESHKHKRDNLTDGCGYLRCTEKVHERADA